MVRQSCAPDCAQVEEQVVTVTEGRLQRSLEGAADHLGAHGPVTWSRTCAAARGRRCCCRQRAAARRARRHPGYRRARNRPHPIARPGPVLCRRARAGPVKGEERAAGLGVMDGAPLRPAPEDRCGGSGARRNERAPVPVTSGGGPVCGRAGRTGRRSRRGRAAGVPGRRRPPRSRGPARGNGLLGSRSSRPAAG